MVSGAGRMVTVRSFSALAARSTTACGSSRYAIALAAAATRASPIPSRPAASPHNSASKARRSSTCKQALSRTIRVARHSDNAPDSSASSVCGISCTSAFAKPRCRPPRAGESRRANAISLATPRPRRAAGTPESASAARRAASRAAAARAWPAAAADFILSSSAMRSINADSPAGGSTEVKVSHMCSSILTLSDKLISKPPTDAVEPA